MVVVICSGYIYVTLIKKTCNDMIIRESTVALSSINIHSNIMSLFAMYGSFLTF